MHTKTLAEDGLHFAAIDATPGSGRLRLAAMPTKFIARLKVLTATFTNH
jgi:hypothetical protein